VCVAEDVTAAATVMAAREVGEGSCAGRLVAEGCFGVGLGGLLVECCEAVGTRRAGIAYLPMIPRGHIRHLRQILHAPFRLEDLSQSPFPAVARVAPRQVWALEAAVRAGWGGQRGVLDPPRRLGRSQHGRDIQRRFGRSQLSGVDGKIVERGSWRRWRRALWCRGRRGRGGDGVVGGIRAEVLVVICWRCIVVLSDGSWHLEFGRHGSVRDEIRCDDVSYRMSRALSMSRQRGIVEPLNGAWSLS
jgi:hypothetical protein